MLNKELFVLNPDENNLKNDGYVEINTAKDELGQQLIYHEIKTFVCKGEYENGLYRILSTYLTKFDEPRQPAAWVSGFYGSGKSHLVKMLSYLWEDFQFWNGVNARQIKALPPRITESLVELGLNQKHYGSIVVRGLLSDYKSSDIRYSFLQLLLFNLGLPTKLHQFRFYYWCKTEGILESLIEKLTAAGKNLYAELNNLFVSRYISKAILELIPDYAETEAQVRDQLGRNFHYVNTITREEFLYTIKSQVLPLFSPKMPCILVVLDEIQQFIGSDEDRAGQVVTLTEDLCENFEGRLLLVGTGQNALNESTLLQKLQDRFTIKIPLGDKDVETVTRKTVLEKKPSAFSAIEATINTSIGEISRLLDGTEYMFTHEDNQTLIADYPILPATRKLWRKLLQAIDVAGTSGQLRSQLRIVDESVKSVAHKELGEIIPADFIFEQKKQQLLQNARLLNEQSNLIEELHAKGGDGTLKARILLVVFLIDLLKDTPKFKLKSDKRIIADLLIDNLNISTEIFRNKINLLIDELVDQDKHLVPIDDEYKLQTRVGAEWEQEFQAQVAKIRGDDTKIFEIRNSRIQSVLNDKLKSINILQGKSKMRRDFTLYYGDTKPTIAEKLNLWLRDGWLENENILLDEIRAESTDTPLAYLYIPKTKDQEIKREIVKMLAAENTLGKKGTQISPEGIVARKSMETRKTEAAIQIGELMEAIVGEAKVFLAGGTLVNGTGDLFSNVKNALESLAIRQFPEFSKADYNSWEVVLRKAMNHDNQALKAIGFNGEVQDHSMKASLCSFIGTQSKQGKDIRSHFAKSPCGWSQDAIDAMLVVLKNSNHLSSPENDLNQRTIAQAYFKVETIVITATQRAEIRALFLEAKVYSNSGEELKKSHEFLKKLDDLAEKIYGDAPKPEFVGKKLLSEIENLDEAERLLSIHNNKEQLKSDYYRWLKDAETIQKRIPEWDLLVRLNHHAWIDKETSPIKSEIETIRNERLILAEPDPIASPLTRLTDILRDSLNDLKAKHNQVYDARMTELQANEYWVKLTPEQKNTILRDCNLLIKPEIKSYNSIELLEQLSKLSLDAWKDKVSALSSKFQQAMDEAIQLLQPTAITYFLPKPTIRNEAELNDYLQKLKEEILEKLKEGNVILK